MEKDKSFFSGRKPFLLKPAGKDYLWGGSRLNDDFSKEIDMSPLAETWECSTHEDGPSVVGSGEFKGMLLKEVLKKNPEFLGFHPFGGMYDEKMGQGSGELPIIVKLIDAKQDLSVQVHPDDAYAAEHENGSWGKSEMWYVLDATKDAHLIYGFNAKISKRRLKNSLEHGTIEKYLQKVRVHKDDVFFVEAGTVHALGAGTLVAEIQENSNVTYRLYDYNRVDKDGNKRELHFEKALDVTNLNASIEPKQPMHVLRYQKGKAMEFLCRCKYFQVERMMINTERCREMADFQTESNSFHVLLCINGCGAMLFGDKEEINFFRGDCIFVPAESELIKIHGKAQFLDITC